RIRQGQGALDDWATPLWAYVLAGAYRLTGVVPGRSLEATVAVAKGTSFLLNLLCLPALYAFARRRFTPDVGLAAMAVLAVLPVISPWAWATFQEYGEPFFTYTKYFPYNFSWTVHHFDKGITRASDFYTWANAPTILRVKMKSIVIIAVYSTMILGAPLMLA